MEDASRITFIFLFIESTPLTGYSLGISILYFRDGTEDFERLIGGKLNFHLQKYLHYRDIFDITTINAFRKD